jgi:hypothetical protein
MAAFITYIHAYDIKKQFGNKGNTFSLIDNHRA